MDHTSFTLRVPLHEDILGFTILHPLDEKTGAPLLDDGLPNTGCVLVGKIVKGGLVDRQWPELQPGARIVSINGEPVSSRDQFLEIKKRIQTSPDYGKTLTLKCILPPRQQQQLPFVRHISWHWLFVLLAVVLAMSKSSAIFYNLPDLHSLNAVIYDSCPNSRREPVKFGGGNVQAAWALSLRENHALILSEFDAFSKSHIQPLPQTEDVQPSQRVLRHNDQSQWSTLFLKVAGVETSAALHFPLTMSLARQSPLFTLHFSIVKPAGQLSFHRGFFRGSLRYHLGLRVPSGPQAPHLLVFDDPSGGDPTFLTGCSTFECAAERSPAGRRYSNVTWEAGKDMLFDDLFEHAVFNPLNEPRIILLGDILREDCEDWRTRAIQKIMLLVAAYTNDDAKNIIKNQNEYFK